MRPDPPMATPLTASNSAGAMRSAGKPTAAADVSQTTFAGHVELAGQPGHSAPATSVPPTKPLAPTATGKAAPAKGDRLTPAAALAGAADTNPSPAVTPSPPANPARSRPSQRQSVWNRTLRAVRHQPSSARHR